MKKLVAFLLASAMLVSVLTLTMTASAEGEKYYGDVNASGGKPDSSDALLILQYAVDKTEFDETQLAIADVTHDEKVDSADALAVLQVSVGKKEAEIVEEEKKQELVKNPTILDNEAYSVDTTADNSFKLDLSNLDPCTIYIVQSHTNSDYRQMMYAFQGLFNREFGKDDDHTSLLYIANDASDTQWLKVCMQQSALTEEQEGIMKNLKKVNIRSFDDFLTTFKTQLIQCGMTLWDANVPATSNVAATICGCDGYLPVMTASDCYNSLVALGVEVKLDLNGKFTGEGKIWGTEMDSTGSTKNDAYRWAMEKYFDRCSANFVAYTLDGAVFVASNPASQLGYSQYNCLENLDYLVARHAFCFDLQPNVEVVCDDRDQVLGTDHATFMMILKRRYERANGEIGRLMGFPPWWVKYTCDTPGDPNHNGVLGGPQLEWLCCQYITSYNMTMEADAQSPSSMSNGSFYYKYRVVSEKFENNTPSEKVTFDSNKHYYTFFVGDYDSSAWMKFYLAQYWKDGTRGDIPLMWTFNPNLSWRIPMIFDYVYSTKTANDYFVSDEGAGYIMPGNLIKNLETGDVRTEEDGVNRWATYCKEYYDLFDMKITGFIINATSGDSETKGLNPTIMKCYNEFNSVGAFHNDGSNSKKSLALYSGVPYVYLYNEIPFGEQPDQYFEGMYSYDTGSMRKFNFSAYRTVVQAPGTIKTLATDYTEYATNRSGKQYVYVDPYTFFDLVRQSGQGTEYNEDYVG